MNKYGCDNCQCDLTYSEGIQKYRLTLSCDICPHSGKSPTMDIYIPAPIISDLHFCGSGCLKQYFEDYKPPQRETDDLSRLKNLFEEEILWYKNHLKEDGEEYIYDEAWNVFCKLGRMQSVEILKVLSRD